LTPKKCRPKSDKIYPILQNKNKKGTKNKKKNIFWFLVVEDKDKPMSLEGLWGHYTSLYEA
jgi:hypothetical protein